MKKCLLSLCLASILSVASGQKISYSDVDRDDYRQMNFEIIGKVNGNTHVYKSYKSRHEISVFDGQMKLKNKMKLAMLPEKVSNVEFVAYPDHYHMLFQSQKRDVVSFSYVKLDGDAKMLAEPVTLDTSHIDGGGEIKVYNVIHSENRERIMVYKISRRNERIYTLTTLLFDRELNLLKRSRVTTQQSNRDGMFNDFVLDNAGDLAFGRSTTTGNREYITNFHLLVKRADADTLTVSEVPLRDFSLDEVKIRPDNYNGRFLLTSFYYGQKKGNIDGLLSLIWDKYTNSQLAAYRFPFSDTLRMDARTDNTSLKLAFNDYFIRQVLPTREGGFAVISELYYTNTRGGAWNRWDYLYGPMGYFPFNNYYYSPFMGINQWRWADPWNRWGAGSGLVRHVSENIMVFFFGRDGRLEWSNTVRKKQYDDNSDVLLSYMLFNTGSEVRFLFNQLERREQVLNSVTLNAAGKIKRDPTMKGLDSNFEFMPRYGKQVGPREVVMPCIYRNYICFAKLDF